MYAVPAIALFLVVFLSNYAGYRSMCLPDAKRVQASFPDTDPVLWLHYKNGRAVAYDIRPDGTYTVTECHGTPYRA